MGAKSNDNGKKGEKIIVSLFRDKGYWVYRTPRSASGSQPVDIIAINGDGAWLVDAKYVRKDEASFSFSDIQPDQISAMNYALHCGVHFGNMGFAIVFERDEDNPRFLSYDNYIWRTDNLNEKSAKMSSLVRLEEVISWEKK